MAWMAEALMAEAVVSADAEAPPPFRATWRGAGRRRAADDQRGWVPATSGNLSARIDDGPCGDHPERRP